MKKSVILTLFLAATCFTLHAQDVIVKSSGEEIKAKVTEVGTAEIKYKRFDNESGPTYTIPKSEVFMITYEDGSKDMFGRGEQTTAAPAPQPASSPASKTYKIGDIYDENGLKGIVVRVPDGEQYGLIMSEEFFNRSWCVKNQNLFNAPTNAFDQNDGEKNMEAIARFVDSGKATWGDFPVFQWAKGLGNGWYIPASNELHEVVVVNFNGGSMDIDLSGKHFNTGLIMFSSTEGPCGQVYVVKAISETVMKFMAEVGLTIKIVPNAKYITFGSNPLFGTRAFHKFSTSNTSPISRQQTNIQTVPIEESKQGDIVDINGVKAIVFQTTGDGHGKAMALDALRGVEKPWCVNSKSNMVKTDDKTNGRANTEKIFRFVQDNNLNINDFPVFAWCRSLGDGWYIPAASELEDFVNFWVGGATELNWDDDVADTQSQPITGDRNRTQGQNEHSQKINQKIAESGGVPFFAGAISSTEEAGKILVFDSKVFGLMNISSAWEMKGVAKGELGQTYYGYAKYMCRAFFEY